MYTFIENIENEKHDEFVKNHPLCSLLQSSSWANIKDNWDHRIVGVYENDELVKISEEISSGYELDTTSVDVSKAGQYPVYVTLSETYDSVTITVRTFFILVVA